MQTRVSVSGLRKGKLSLYFDLRLNEVWKRHHKRNKCGRGVGRVKQCRSWADPRKPFLIGSGCTGTIMADTDCLGPSSSLPLKFGRTLAILPLINWGNFRLAT